MKLSPLAYLGTVALIAMALATGAQAETRIQKTFGAWLVNCVQKDGEANRCTLSQTFQKPAADGQRAVFAFSWSVGTGPDGVERAILRTPVNVNLAQDISVGLPDGDKAIIPFRQCIRQVCLGVTEFADTWSDTMIKQDTLEVIYTLINRGRVKVSLDLTGFSDAYAFFQQNDGKE